MIRAGVVDHQRIGPSAGDDHRVPRRGLAELAVKQQVAG